MELHQRFDRRELTHKQWCKESEKCFKSKNLHKTTVESIANGIFLLPSVEDTFKFLHTNGIKIYIVSGSIDYVIDTVLGENLKYVAEVKANYFVFDSKGFLEQNVGTEFDFEGKARYIKSIAHELQISPADILFVGNSNNDEYAFQSGADTLCINPSRTSPYRQDIWKNLISNCRNLKEILKFVKS